MRIKVVVGARRSQSPGNGAQWLTRRALIRGQTNPGIGQGAPKFRESVNRLPPAAALTPTAFRQFVR
jgi:hypothetical protein